MAALVLALLLGAVVAVFLVGHPADDAPSGAASGAAPEATGPESAAIFSVAPMAGELFVSQVIGMRGCGEPVFVTGGGLPPRTRVRLERVDDGRELAAETSQDGFVAFDGGALFTGNCEASVPYTLRLVNTASGGGLAHASFEAPVFAGSIEVEPTLGGCGEIVVTPRGMPADQEVRVFMAEPASFAHNFASIAWPPLRSDGERYARSERFRPPWSCETAAGSCLRPRAG